MSEGCPCKDRYSWTWHDYHGLTYCENAKKLRRRAKEVRAAQARKNGRKNTGKRKPPAEPLDPCPCGDGKSDRWHTMNKVPHCAKSREYRNSRKRLSRRSKEASGNRWANGMLPGTNILIPEYDPL